MVKCTIQFIICIRTIKLELSIMVKYRIISIIIMVFVQEKIFPPPHSLLVIFGWFRKYFGWKKCNRFNFISLTEQKLETYLKLFILLYADDTVILAGSSDDMQDQINYFYEFCMKWRLKVDIEKSNVLGFFLEWLTTKQH